MITEPQIVDKLSTIDQYHLERLITHLLYQGAYVNIVQPNQLLETFGSNIDKQRTIKSPGHADAELRELGVYIETSADEEWVRKFKKDISKNRGNRVRTFVFCTNQNASSDKTLKIRGSSIPAREYCRRELGCGECFIIGRQQLLPSLRDPNFAHLRREFLKIPEEHFHSPAIFLENLRSNPFYQTCVEEATLQQYSTGVGRALPFSPKELTILYANDYITLLHALGIWAQGERESQEIISTDHCFINYPAPNTSLHDVDHRELSPTVESFLYVWGAHQIKNLSEYLKFSRSKTSLIFVTTAALKEEVAGILNSSSAALSIRYVSVPSLEDRKVTSQELFDHERILRSFMNSVPNDLMRVEALIYLYSPLYVTNQALRTRMCTLLNIDDNYLGQLFDFLVRSEVGAVTGDIIWLKQAGVAKKLLNDLITEGVFAVEGLFEHISSKENQLAKLMSLDNPQANAYLDRFASDIYSAIEALPTNDEIIEQLELLESFIYKVPAVALRVIDFVISHPTPATPISTVFGELEGKHHKELVLKCVDMLGRIRYLESDGVLERLAPLIASDDQMIANKAKSVLQSFAKFDLNLLINSDLGYGPQAKGLEFIKKWPIAVQLENLDFVEVILTEILRSSIEGTSMEDPDSVSVRFGAVQPNEFLKNLRRETIALIYEIYSASSMATEQLRLVRILQEACRTPHLGGYSDDVAKMIQDDTKLVVETYRMMLLGEHDALLGNIVVAKNVEKTLSFYEQDQSIATEAHDLKSAILSDRFYKLFRLLVGSDADFDPNVPWREVEQKRRAKIDQIVDSLGPSDLGQWIEDLSRIASQAEFVNGFELRHFEYFLRALGAQRSAVATKVLTDALEHDKPLAVFAAHLLDGLRNAGQLAFWDMAADLIAHNANPRHVSAILWPLSIYQSVNLEREIREQDLRLLEDVVNRDGDFTFLAGCEEELPQLRAAIVNALVRLFRRDERRIESLLVKELGMHPEYRLVQISAIHAGILREHIDCASFSPEVLEFLKQWLIEFQDLDWDAQDVMLNAARNDPGIVLDVFRGRIEKHRSLGPSPLGPERYESVPFNLNPGFTSYLSRFPELKPKLVKWVEDISPDDFRYAFDLSRLLNEIGAVREIQLGLIEAGDEESLRKAVALVNPATGGNIETLMEVVRRTDNESILGKVAALLYATGVVWGEYGIADALESKKQMLSQYLEDESERVRRFAERTIKGFDANIKEERKRVDEQREERRIEFEG